MNELKEALEFYQEKAIEHMKKAIKQVEKHGFNDESVCRLNMANEDITRLLSASFLNTVFGKDEVKND